MNKQQLAEAITKAEEELARLKAITPEPEVPLMVLSADRNAGIGKAYHFVGGAMREGLGHDTDGKTDENFWNCGNYMSSAAQAKAYAAPIPAPAVPSVPDGCAIVSRTLTPEAWKRLCNADIWPVTPRSFQRMLDVLMEVAMLQEAPAPSVPEEWREVMAGLVGIAEAKGKKHGSPNHSHSRPGFWDDDNIRNGLAGKPCAECAMYDKARALLQSAPAKDSGV